MRNQTSDLIEYVIELVCQHSQVARAVMDLQWEGSPHQHDTYSFLPNFP